VRAPGRPAAALLAGLAAPVLDVAARPGVVEACASCLSSPYGDRTYNWAFLGLLLMPFLVAAGIAGVLLYHARGGARHWLHRVVHRSPGGRPVAPAAAQLAAHEETTTT